MTQSLEELQAALRDREAALRRPQRFEVPTDNECWLEYLKLAARMRLSRGQLSAD